MKESGNTIVLSMHDINRMFDHLIKEQKSREEVHDWAWQLYLAEDEGILCYEPSACEDLIWEGLCCLLGADAEDANGAYLHSIEQFVGWKKALNLKLSS